MTKSLETSKEEHPSKRPRVNNYPQADYNRYYSQPVIFESSFAFVNAKPKISILSPLEKKDYYNEVISDVKDESYNKASLPKITVVEEIADKNNFSISSPYSKKRSRWLVDSETKEGENNEEERNQNNNIQSPTVIGEHLVNNSRPRYLTANITARKRPLTGSRPSTVCTPKTPMGGANKVFHLPSKVMKQYPKPTTDIRKVDIKESIRPPYEVFFEDIYNKRPLSILNLSSWLICDEELEIIGSKCHNSLTEIHLPNSLITDDGLKFLDPCKNIHTINLNFCKNLTGAGIKFFIRGHSKIKKMSLRETLVDDEGIDFTIRGLKLLEELDIRKCINISDSALVSIAERPFLFTPLRIINLRDNLRITDKGTLVLLGGIRRTEEIDFRGCKGLTDLTFMSCVAQKNKLFLWKILNLSGMYITDVGLNWIAEGCLLLTNISLDGCKDITDRGIISLFDNVKNIIELSISQCFNITDDGFKNIPNKVEKLNLTDCCNITDKGIQYISMNCANSLTSIVIVGLNYLTNVAFKHFSNHCTCLEIINVSGREVGGSVGMQAFYGAPKIGDDAARYLAHGKCRKSLKTIYFGCLLRLTDIALAEFGGGCENLECLIVNSCIRITDQGIISLVTKSKNLKKLNISKIEHITDLSLEAIGANCDKLVSLDIFNADNVTDTGIEKLVIGCKKLEFLNLHWCVKLTDKTMYSIAEHCHNLISLNCEGMYLISNEALFEVAKSNLNLNELKLQGCDKITNHTLSNIMKMLIFSINNTNSYGLKGRKDINEYRVREKERSRQINLHAKATIIQCHYKGLLSRRKSIKLSLARTMRRNKLKREKENKSAIIIQSLFRGHKARKWFKRWKIKINVSALKIQKVYRGYTGRKLVKIRRKQVKELKAKRWRASKKIQFWYRGLVQMSLANSLLKQKKEDYKKRSKSARLIQRVYRGYKGRVKARRRRQFLLLSNQKALESAIIIQKNYRGYRSRKITMAKRERYTHAAIVIQKNFRSYNDRKYFSKRLIITSAAATKIQTVYRKRRARVSFKIRLALKQQKDKDRESAAIIIQRLIRHFLAQSKVKMIRLIRMKKRIEALAATEIQRIYRGFKDRKRVKMLKRIKKLNNVQQYGYSMAVKKKLIRLGAAILIQGWYKPHYKRKKEKKRLVELRWDSAIVIQAFFRGCVGRRRFKAIYKEREKAAITLQTIYRRHLAKLKYRKMQHLRAEEREKARREEQQSKAEAKKRKEKEAKIMEVFMKAKTRAAILIQRRARDFLKIRRVKRVEQDKIKKEEREMKLLELMNNNANGINLAEGVNKVRGQAADIGKRMSTTILGFGKWNQKEEKKEEMLSDEEFLLREQFKRDEKSLERREMFNKFQSFFSADKRAEAAKQLQDKIQFSILSKQKIIVHQIGIAGFEMTIGSLETEEFGKAQAVNKNAGLPFFQKIDIDLGQLHTDYHVTPPTRKSLEVYLWYKKTASKEIVSSFEFVKKPPAPKIKPDLWAKKRMEEFKNQGLIVGTHKEAFCEIKGKHGGNDPIVDIVIIKGSEGEEQLTKMGFVNYNMDPSPLVCNQVEAKGLQTFVLYNKIEKDKNQIRLEGRIREEKFYDETLQAQMDFLGLGEFEVRELHKVFRMMDTNGGGTVSCDELVAFVKEGISPLVIELFNFLEETAKDGEWKFGQFVHAVSTLCLWGRNELLHFCFTYFDKDASGSIDADELRALIEIQSKGAPAFLNKKKILELTKEYDGKGLRFEAFDDFDKSMPLLLYPIFRLQTAIQKVCLGIEFWEGRKELFMAGRKEIKKNREAKANAPPAEVLLLEVGMKILAKRNGKGDFKEGRITYINRDDTFTVLFDDGSRDPKVKRDNIMKYVSDVEKQVIKDKEEEEKQKIEELKKKLNEIKMAETKEKIKEKKKKELEDEKMNKIKHIEEMKNVK